MATTPITTNVPTDVSTSSQIDWATLGPAILSKFIDVLLAAFILVVAYFLTRYVRARLRKVEIQHDQQRNAINLFEKITNGFIIVISITIALKIVGIDMTLLVSVSILGLSYGLQDVIKNYVAGILILFKAPFKIGNTINIRGYTGKVDRMDFQATTLKTFDNRYITIYNSDVMTQSIVNFSHADVRAISIEVQLGYGSDLSTVFQIFEKILSNNSHILKSPVHRIVFKSFTNSGPVFVLKGWVKMPANLMAIKTEMAKQIYSAFNESNIYIPYEKTIQLETDYTLTPERQTAIQNAKTALETLPGPTPEEAAEQLDFDEPDPFSY